MSDRAPQVRSTQSPRGVSPAAPGVTGLLVTASSLLQPPSLHRAPQDHLPHELSLSQGVLLASLPKMAGVRASLNPHEPLTHGLQARGPRGRAVLGH